jgi:quercetin dioxygenase-like cupin family protein
MPGLRRLIDCRAQMLARKGRIMETQNGDVVRIGSLELRFLVDETQGSGSVVVFEFVVPPNARVPAPHFHRQVDEVIYALAGTVTTTLDGRKHELRSGESLFLPRGSIHNHENFHPETAKALIVLTPGLIGRRYFEEIAREVNAPEKPDLAKVKEIMLPHGLVPA